MSEHQQKTASTRGVRYLSANTEREVEFKMMVRDMLGHTERQVRMPWGKVAKYYSGDEKTSVLEMDDGTRVYVGLAFDDLCERMERAWSTREKRLDLKEVTGDVIDGHMRWAGIANHFDIKAMSNDMHDDDLLIIMYGFEGQDMSSTCRKVAFFKSDIKELKESSPWDYVCMKDFSRYNGSWDMGSIGGGPYIRISKEEFADKVTDAVANGQVVLDLSEETKPDAGILVDANIRPSKRVKVYKRSPRPPAAE